MYSANDEVYIDIPNISRIRKFNEESVNDGEIESALSGVCGVDSKLIHQSNILATTVSFWQLFMAISKLVEGDVGQGLG